MDTAPLVFTVQGKSIELPRDPTRLPGMSPAAVDRVLGVLRDNAVDPKAVDVVAANLKQAAFAVEVSTLAVAETLRRIAGLRDLDAVLQDVRLDSDFETVAEAFKGVAVRNKSVFGDPAKAKPAEPPTGN